ncbi:FAD/FMN-containing dehydrogenase [Stakelama pacifica]|uniref:FAD/FMN-containing dehydrogenase n=2 Tax=Stakelama pacifica TaxID=517720 RepID=A0A4R6FCS6_9SPHN|nr:FAD/FMN-containing dehydrogenase [Stakelama pacifica]GGP00429.1 D-2-hydroxyacid dehydrogenase [Stakelama pacifica]
MERTDAEDSDRNLTPDELAWDHRHASPSTMVSSSQKALIDFARERLGERGVVVDRDDLAPWLTDWRGRYHGDAPALLQPDTLADVAAILERANALGVALVPQGGNTSMVGGATPPADGSALILSLRRMNRIRRIDADQNLAVAEAGVILQNLHEAAEAQGRRFPLTLGARGSATIGGLVSTNAGGTQVLRHGTMRALVAGVEAVLPDGAIHDGLAPLKKDNRGYDLNQLLIGAEGTLGIITAATLRLVPAIARRAVAWVGLDHPRTALNLLRRIEARTDAIESFEIIPGDSLALVLSAIPDTRAPLASEHRWHVLIEAVSGEGEELDPKKLLETVLADAFEAGMAEDAVIAASESQAEALWKLRHSLSEAERSAGPAVQHDISVPVAAMPDFMIDAAREAEARFPGTHATAFGHLGDGNVHFHVRAPQGAGWDRWYAQEAETISRFVNDLVVAAGGSISAEHGIGQMKLHELERLGSPARLSMLRAVKAAIDPRAICNPGKLVSLAPASRGT